MKLKWYSRPSRILVILVFLLSSSCALKPITSSYDFVPMPPEIIDLENLGNGIVLIHNGANILHKADNTARLNVWINDKPMGQLRASEYVVLKLDKGTYSIRLLHIDLVNMRSTHEVAVDENTKVIRVKPTITSNKLTQPNELPKNFEKFSYAKKR
ncbi:hypothetical protein [Ascidiimonas sp. W6]|uniref:hypothetical protein n=1 Tax=Ascidiimonas meishanensis TaxID=3128903 RepID=UPI0030EB3A2B